MASVDVKKVRSFCMVAHSGSGKTSLAEALLFNGKMTTRLGSVPEGNTVSDYNEDEIQRNISITAKPMYTEWKGNRIFVIDTPGFADFVGEVISSVRVSDSAVVLVDATGGVEVGTERVWGFLERVKKPRCIFINKLDKDNTDFLATVKEIQERFGNKCIPMTVPNGSASSFSEVINLLTADTTSLDDTAKKYKQNIIETASESDDALLEKYLEQGELTADEVKQGLKQGIQNGELFPVFCGNAVSNLGVDILLDSMVDLFPDPTFQKVSAKVGDEEKEIAVDPTSGFSAFVFKSISDPYVGQLSVFKVISGSIQSNGNIVNVTNGSKEHVGQLYILQGKTQVPVDSLQAGEMGALAKLKDVSTGDTLSDGKQQMLYPQMKFPSSAYSVSIKPHSKNDEEKIMGALQKIQAEDQTFTYGRDPQTKELLVSGLGDLHIDIMLNRIKERFKVGIDVGLPKVPYKETIKGSAKVQGKFKRQSGGRGQYGDCWISIEPLEHGEGFEFVDKIVGGSIPRNYIPSVEKGVVASMAEGILSGCPVVDVRVTLLDGSFHAVDSSDMAFQIAGSMAFKKAQEEAKPILLEPVMKVEVVVPPEFMGNISGALNSHRGRVLGMGTSGKMEKIQALVPLSEMFTYSSELKSQTGGRGSYSMEFDHYEEVPARIAQDIIEKHKAGKEEATSSH